MSENLLANEAFYPHGGPPIYSYTEEFYNEHKTTGEQAKENTNYMALVFDQEKSPKRKIANALNNLDMLISGARSAEMKFLADTKIDITNSDNAKTIYENYNTFFSMEALVERSKTYLTEIVKNRSDSKFVDPTKYFFTYLEKAIQELAVDKKFNIKQSSAEDLEKLLEAIISKAFIDTFDNFKEFKKDGNRYVFEGTPKEEETYIQDMKAVADELRKLNGKNLFAQYAPLLELEKTLRENADSTGIIAKAPKYTIKSFDSGGKPLEILNATLTSALANIHLKNKDFIIDGIQTGSGEFNQQKGDVMLAMAKANVSIPWDEMRKIFDEKRGAGSKRLQNIDALEEFLKLISDSVKHLIVFSDKNYGISIDVKTGSGGKVHAQDNMKLAYVKQMFEKFRIPNSEDLINYLANCGAGMIHKKYDARIRNVLASYIAYFLFDYVEITGPSSKITNTNVVNIINLGNIFIPLSVYLEGVKQSLSLKLSGLGGADLVSVSLTLGGGPFPDGPWTQSSWTQFRDLREENSGLSYDIMSDIASYLYRIITPEDFG